MTLDETILHTSHETLNVQFGEWYNGLCLRMLGAVDLKFGMWIGLGGAYGPQEVPYGVIS